MHDCFCIIIGDVPIGETNFSKDKKIGYLGGSDSPKFKIKYKGHKLYLKGYAWKTSGTKMPKASYAKKKTKITKTVKIGDNCQFVCGEGMEDIKFKFKNKEQLKSYCGKENTWVTQPFLYVVVKGKNAVYISMGA